MSDGAAQLDLQKLINDVVALLHTMDPVGEGLKLADQGRRTIEALIVALENAGATMDNLNQAASRVNRLLDDVEEPIRRMAGLADQAGSLVGFLPSLAGRAMANFAPKSTTSDPRTAQDNVPGSAQGDGTSPPTP